MKKVPEENTGKYVLEELLTALAIVVELAQGNCLDTHDPDMADECDRQLGAVDLVKQFVADNTPELLGPTAGIIPPMNRYETEYAVDRIDGYFLPKPHESGKKGEIDAFNRAKAECLLHLERQIECTKALSVEQFYQAKKRPLPI